MSTSTRIVVWASLLSLAVLAACGTPEVAEEYQERSLVPAEIEAALGSDDPLRRSEAAAQVEKLPPERRRAVLLELLDHPRSAVRLTALTVLARSSVSGGPTVDRLTEVVSLDPDPDVRVAAVRALAASGDVRALDAILAALSDDLSLAVRVYAAATLDRLTAREFGAGLADRFDEAEAAADDAAFSWLEWLEANRDALEWDPGEKRFRTAEEGR